MANIFVGNLSYETTQEELQATFSQFGAVESVNIIRDRDTGQSRGFAFVEMTHTKEAQNAISRLDGLAMHGRALKVNEARPKPSVGSERGGFGGQRRSSGGGRGNRW